jgi:hypothetical protein
VEDACTENVERDGNFQVLLFKLSDNASIKIVLP